jgi:cation diffusion facilitator CzcD-associated flavoprotein CzcO
MPRSYPKYPSRDQVVRYLEDYAAHHRLEPRFGTEVTALRRSNGGWRVETTGESYDATDVVIATGATHTPHIPEWPGREDFTGEVLHSARYDNGRRHAGKRVLVVGFGNSGGEIAIDLVEHGAEVGMAVRSPVNVVPRDVFGLPILSVGIALGALPPRVADALGAPLVRATVGDIEALGLKKLPYGPVTQMVEHERIPLLDIGTVGLIRKGKIAVHPGIERFTADGVTFVDGTTVSFDAVVLATGYRPALDGFLEGADELTGDKGLPRRSGEEVRPGLYFCGFYVSPTGMLREIGIEAERIAAAIASA